jgi:hypothetical protein
MYVCMERRFHYTPSKAHIACDGPAPLRLTGALTLSRRIDLSKGCVLLSSYSFLVQADDSITIVLLVYRSLVRRSSDL